jgi:O-antigen ligase
LQVLLAVGRGVLAAAALIAAQSIYWSDTAPLSLQLIVTALGALACWRPAWGLLALAALAPFGRLIAIVWLRGYPVRGAEAFALAFLAGVALRQLGARRGPGLPAWAAGPWLVFGAVVTASAAVLHRTWQVHHDFPLAFMGLVLERVAFDYQDLPGDLRIWLEPPGIPYVSAAIVVLAGVALLLVTAWLCQANPVLARRLTGVTVVAGAVAGALGVNELIVAALESGEGLAALPALAVDGRFAAHVTKVNTAGSYFVLVLPMAVGLAWHDRARRAGWTAAAAVLAVALWLTASLAAMLAAAVIAAAAGLVAGWRLGRARPAVRLTATILVAAALAAGGGRVLTRSDAAASFQRRIAISGVSLQTTAEAPVFGVGLATYAQRSSPYVTPEVIAGFGSGGVDPHNYVLEILAELGVVGLVSFLWAAGVAIGLTWTRHAAGLAPWGLPAALGLFAFLLSSLSGQPMQVDAVAMPVWIVLGLVLAQAPVAARRRPAWGWWAIGIAAVLATIPFRAAREVDAIDPAVAAQNATWAEGDDGRGLWRISGRARLFVDGRAPAVDVEARTAEPGEAGALFLRADGEGFSVRPLDLTDVWRRTCADVAPEARKTGVRALDLTGLTAAGGAAESEEIWVRVAGRDRPCGVY